MGEKIFTHVEKYKGVKITPDNVGSSMSLDRKWSVFADDNKVGIVGSVLRCGRANKDTVWHKWVTTTALGFRRQPNGNVVPYLCHRKESGRKTDLWKNERTHVVFSLLEENTPKFTWQVPKEVPPVFKREVSRRLGVNSLYDIYPLAERYGFHQFAAVPYDLREAFRQTTVEDATRVAFGKSRMDASLVRAVAEGEPYVVSLAHQMRGYTDNKNLPDFINNNVFDEDTRNTFTPHSVQLRGIMPVVEPLTVDHLLADTIDDGDLSHLRSLLSEGCRPVGIVKRHRELKKKIVASSWYELATFANR